MALNVPDLYPLVEDYTLDPTGASGTSVPTTRSINTTAPLTGGGDLSVDRTLALTTDPPGDTPVGNSRQVTTTAPLLGGGALTSNLNLTMQAFDNTQDGYVVKNPAGAEGKFLRDDGTFQTGAVSGVSDLAGTAPIQVDTPTGSVTVSVDQGGIAVGGIVPATGGADATKYLCATNPLTWAVPGTANTVLLQAVTPGATQTGHANISGTMLTGKVAAGTTSPLGVVSAVGDGSLPGQSIAKFANSATAPKTRFQAARGTEGTPTFLNDADGVAALTVYPRIGGSFAEQPWITAYADGAGSGLLSFQPTYTDVLAGALSNYGQVRLSQGGLRVQTSTSLMAGADRALHTLDVQGSLGLKLMAKSSAFNASTSAAVVYLCDATAGAFNATLPTAVGISGRVYGFVKVDETVFRPVSVVTSGGQTINGVAGIQLYTKGQHVFVQSDGSNWWIVATNIEQTISAPSADSAAIANDATEQVLTTVSIWNTGFQGESGRYVLSGKLSTTGTPTLRFKIKNSADFVLADSTALTMGAGVSNIPWQIEYEGINRTAGATGKVARAILGIGPAAGAMTFYNMISNYALGAVSAIPSYVTVQWGAADPANTITCIQSIFHGSPSSAII